MVSFSFCSFLSFFEYAKRPLVINCFAKRKPVNYGHKPGLHCGDPSKVSFLVSTPMGRFRQAAMPPLSLDC